MNWSFLLLLCCSIAICHSQEHYNISVSKYSLWVSRLPNFTVPFLNNMALSKFDLPSDVSPLFSSLGYVSLTLVFGVVLFGCIVGFTLAQFFCTCFSDTNVKYVSLERFSAKVLMITVLGTIILYAFASTYFYFGYYNNVWDSVDSVVSEVDAKLVYFDTMKAQIATIDPEVANVTVPDVFLDIQNSSRDLTTLLTSKDMKSAKVYQMWGPIAFVVLVGIVSVLGIVSVHKEMRAVVAIVGFLFFIFFVIQLVMSLTGTTMTLIFSDICATGIDNNTKLLISIIENDCAQEVVEEIIFCREEPTMCTPFHNFEGEIDKYEQILREKIENSENPDPVWEETITKLVNVNNSLSNLAECRNAQYQQITFDLCSTTTKNLVLLSTLWQDTTAFMFIFMMVILYGWNRIKKLDASIYSKVTQMDIEFSSNPSSDSDVKIDDPNIMSVLNFKERSCSCGCFGFFMAMLLFWGGLIFSTVIIFLTGSGLTTVPRN